MKRDSKTHKDRKSEDEYPTFESALKKVLSVPRSEMRATLDAEKKHHRRASSRASGGKA